MARTYFITGFPGFVSSNLIKKLVDIDHDARFELLVYRDQIQKAYHAIEDMVHYSKITIIEGDITKSELGIDEGTRRRLTEEVTHVFHLAAIYDLAVPEDIAHRVNVNGTRNVLDFILPFSSLKRFIYFSTAYVSGDRSGSIYEDELECGQAFKNYYEETKYEAEVMVHSYMNKLPITIIRPGVVMGHSKTGETAKFDGPYFMMRFLDKFARLPIPYIGGGEALINLVPIDYVVDATTFLAHDETAKSKVFHLTDPEPLTVREVYRLIAQTLVGKTPSYTLPSSFVSKTLSLSLIRKWVQVERETIDYFTLQAYYDSANTIKHLKGTGIVCPRLADYMTHKVDYYKKHRHEPEKLIKVN